jgi:hypothetical protein
MKVGQLKTLSTLFFLAPLLLAIYFRIWISALLLVGVIFASFKYHLANEKKFSKIDRLHAWLLIASNLVICYLGKFKLPFFAIALLLVVLSFYFYIQENKNQKYDINHSLWHISSSLITVFSILTFVGLS